MTNRARFKWEHYLVALVCAVVMFAVRLVLDRYEVLPVAKFLLLSTPVVVAGWLGGFWPGMFATFLCILGADYFFLEPTGEFDFFGSGALPPLLIYLVQGVIISGLGHSRQKALNQLEHRVERRTGELMRSNEQLKHEVIERLAAGEQLEAMNARLEISNRELQDFASVASHDLQEPLRKIQAFGDRLRVKCGDSLGEEATDYLNRMQNAAERMQTLINDLLTFSRVTTQAQPFLRIDLNRIVSDVLSDLETRIEQVNAIVKVEALPRIEADALQIRQLFQNLLGNALKFGKPEVSPVIRIHCAELDNEVRIHIQDNGIGFDEKYLTRIFTVFQRLHSRGTYEGTGIGLAVCRRIVERHGGEITAHSRPGQGATFEFTLPRRQNDQPEGDAGDAESSETHHDFACG